MGVKIYYFSFDKDLEGLADWIPIKDENETVKAEESKKINFKDIWTNRDRELKNGDEIVMYWWTDEFFEKNHSIGDGNVGDTNGRETITL